MNLTRHIRFQAARDLRTTAQGIHGVDLLMWVAGDEGAMVVRIFTHWLPGALRDEVRYNTGHAFCEPEDAGLFAHTPFLEGIPGCPFLGGQACRMDSWSPAPDQYINALIERGSEGVFDLLEAKYRQHYRNEP